MAIHSQEIVEMSGGFSKEIDSGATELMFDTLQRFQYQWPIKSTIREVVSNALDSIREKNIAKSILNGNSKVEDHYIEKAGEAFKDSRFNPEYYNLSFLSDYDNVHVIYKDGGENGKDSVVIEDQGVALGANRLRGYFNLGYSTKRLNRFALGKFGLGAKSPLSTGTPFYTVTSRWNGMEFVFNVYGHRVEPLVPKYDLENMIENPFITFDDYLETVTYTNAEGELITERRKVPIYYRRIQAPNIVRIELPVKKHHKQQYLDAVTQQLLYFSNVKLFVEEDGELDELPVKANILYEDDMIVMSTNAPYSKPHLLLNGVNYGYIDFRELELEEKLGNIGIKVAPEKVSINPSRESLIWDDTTREVVVNLFNEVVGIASNVVNQQLQETDFVEWMRICSNTSNVGKYFNSNTVIGRLSQIVDMSKIELSYPLNKELKFNYSLLDGVRALAVRMESVREGSKTIAKVAYSPGWRGALTDALPIVLLQGTFSNRKNKYLLQKVYPSGFIAIVLEYDNVEGGVRPEHVTNLDRVLETFDGRSKGDRDVLLERGRVKIANLHNYLYASKNVIYYDSVTIPEWFKGTEESAEEITEDIEEKVKQKEARQSTAERRKLEGKTIVHTPTYGTFTSIEFPIKRVDEWSSREIFWGNQDSSELLSMAYTMNFGSTRVNKQIEDLHLDDYKLKGGYSYKANFPYFIDNPDLMLIKVAQNNTKYYQDFKHITRFFREIRNKTIGMANALVRWNTARLLKKRFHELEFMNGLSSLDPTRYNKYQSVANYIKANEGNAISSSNDALLTHLDKVGSFQLFVRENPEDKEAIAELAQQLFNPSPGVEIEDGLAIDTWVFDLCNELLDWAQPVKILLNMVSALCEADEEDREEITDEQEMEIRSYFKYRGVPLN